MGKKHKQEDCIFLTDEEYNEPSGDFSYEPEYDEDKIYLYTYQGTESFLDLGEKIKNELENSKVAIAGQAFSGCKNLEEIIIPKEIVEIEGLAFAENETIKKVTILAPIKELGNSMFDGCINLEEVILPETLEVIEEEAFWGCKNLKKLIIPEGVKKIESDAFSDSYIDELYLPNRVSLCKYAFSGCEIKKNHI